MKNTLLLLSAVCCLTLPAAVRADDVNSGPPSVKTATARAKAGKAAARASAKGQKIIYYITTQPRTGSNIPMTYRQYGGRIDSACSPAVYGSTAIRSTGAEDTAGVLYRLDPNISVGRGR